MRHLNENLLVRFTVLGGVIMVSLGVLISVVVTSRLNQNLAALETAGADKTSDLLDAQDRTTIGDLSRDIKSLRSVTYGTVGGGFVIMYIGLVFIVWRGWRTTNQQRFALEAANAELEDRVEQRVEELRKANEQLRIEVGTRLRAEDNLRDSRRRITNAEEAVRKQIAEMLHGRVQTSLLVAWHRLGECVDMLDSDANEAKRLLTRVRDEVEQIREQEVRGASHLLHPSIIRVGLLPAVRSLASRVEQDIEVSIDVAPRVVELDSPVDNLIAEDLRLVAYRVVEEGLSCRPSAKVGHIWV